MSVCVFVPILQLISRLLWVGFGENVGTLVKLIVSKFHTNRISFLRDCDVISIFKKLFQRKTTLLKAKEKDSVQGKQFCCARL